MSLTTVSDAELIERLRRAAMIWFKNSDLLLLEELLRRYGRTTEQLARHDRTF